MKKPQMEQTKNSSLLTHNPSLTKLLLVEDNPGDANLIRLTLAESKNYKFEFTHVERLSRALRCIKEERFDVILLDLLLPDGTGIETFLRLVAHAPEVPTIVLTGMDNEKLAIQALQNGAQDYLIKDQIDANLLVRSIRYAIERHRVQMAMRGMSLTDELTGLYNRRGFLSLAEQQLRLAQRTKRGLLLIFADLDELKHINDAFSHKEGDTALVETANVLRDTFRSSDIIARIGGDEFVVLAIETSGANVSTILCRLQSNVDAYNAKATNPYALSLSIGTAYYDPDSPHSIDELLSRADKLMYEQKIRKKIEEANEREGL